MAQKSILRQVVEQRLDSPSTLGRLACHLRRNDEVEQQHHDDRKLHVYWRERPGHWRCTIFVNKDSDLCLAQIDIHEDGDVRIESWEPCSISVSPENDFLVLNRFRPVSV